MWSSVCLVFRGTWKLSLESRSLESTLDIIRNGTNDQNSETLRTSLCSKYAWFAVNCLWIWWSTSKRDASPVITSWWSQNHTHVFFPCQHYLILHGHLSKAASLETRHWPLTFYTPLPAVSPVLCPCLHSPTSLPSLSQCQCASRGFWKPSLISQLYIYLCSSTLPAFPAA